MGQQLRTTTHKTHHPTNIPKHKTTKKILHIKINEKKEQNKDT